MKNFRASAHLTQDTFADRCNRYVQRFGGDKSLHFSRHRIGRLERAGTERTRADALKRDELEVIAAVIGVTPGSLVGKESRSAARFSDPTREEVAARQLRKRLSIFIDNASEVHGWGRWLPASLELPAFMERRHAVLYEADAQRWNALGRERWHALRDAAKTFCLYHYTFLRDLEAIADGVGIYASFPASLRTAQLRDLANSIETMGPRVTLIVADDRSSRSACDVATDFGECDTALVVDNRIAMWRDCNGITGISQRPSQIGYWRGLLDEIKESSPCADRGAAQRLLRRLVATSEANGDVA